MRKRMNALQKKDSKLVTTVGVFASYVMWYPLTYLLYIQHVLIEPARFSNLRTTAL
jgi:hypothetical protein